MRRYRSSRDDCVTGPGWRLLDDVDLDGVVPGDLITLVDLAGRRRLGILTAAVRQGEVTSYALILDPEDDERD